MRSSMRAAVALLGLAWASAASATDIYTWTDAEGTVHYSSIKPRAAESERHPAWDGAVAPAAPRPPAEQYWIERSERLEMELDRQREARMSEAERRARDAEDELRAVRRERERFGDECFIGCPPPTGSVVILPEYRGLKGLKPRHGKDRDGRDDARDTSQNVRRDPFGPMIYPSLTIQPRR